VSPFSIGFRVWIQTHEPRRSERVRHAQETDMRTQARIAVHLSARSGHVRGWRTTWVSVLVTLLVASADAAPNPRARAVADAARHGGSMAGPVTRALALLNETNRRVVLFDPLQYRAPQRARLEQFEAFVLREHREIYLNRRGRAFEEALAGRSEGVYLLAAILVHELAHLDGYDERAALQAEQGCVFRFMKEGRISVDVALAHLQGA
jgi:hypothetical protein